MREKILQEIRRLADADGQPPGSRTFAKETGIGVKQWHGVYWARWSDAIADAGLEPNSATEKLPDPAIFEMLALAIRHFGRTPTKMELRLYRKLHPELPTDRTIDKRFGRKSELLSRLSEWANSRPDFADVAALLPQTSTPHIAHSANGRAEGLVYLIQSGAFYKIGRSDELERRVKEIKVALPEAATLVHTIRTDDPPGIEAYWHRRFADRRANGEWFKLTVSDVASFKRRKYQ